MTDKSDANPYATPSSAGGEPSRPMSTGARLAEAALAGGLSILFAGVGQAYNRQWIKTIVFIIGAFVLWFLLLGWVVHCWSIADAAVECWYQTGSEDVSRGRMILFKLVGFLVALVFMTTVTYIAFPALFE